MSRYFIPHVQTGEGNDFMHKMSVLNMMLATGRKIVGMVTTVQHLLFFSEQFDDVWH